MAIRFVNKKSGKLRSSKDFEVKIIKKRKINKPEINNKNPDAEKDDSTGTKET